MIRPTDERLDQVLATMTETITGKWACEDIKVSGLDLCTLIACARIVRHATEPSGDYISKFTTTVKEDRHGED